MSERKKKVRKKRDEKVNGEKNIRERMINALDLPKEVALNVPKITIVGQKSIFVENYKGVIEYDNNLIRLNTNIGVISISGRSLTISWITNEDTMVNGDIEGIEFVK